jgi:ankyrin repeat protein
MDDEPKRCCRVVERRDFENVNEKDEDGYTPLHIASWSGHLSCMRELIKRGADVNEKDDFLNQPSLHFAALFRSFDCIKLLIENGANVDEVNNEGELFTVFIGDRTRKEVEKFIEDSSFTLKEPDCD